MKSLADLAQLVEQRIRNAQVVSSSLTISFIFLPRSLSGRLSFKEFFL